MTSTAPRRQKLPRGVSELRPGTFRARVSYDGRQILIGTFTTVRDARAAVDIARGEMARGTFIPPGERRAAIKAAELAAEVEAARAAFTVDDLAVEWFAFLERTGRAVSTVYSYRRRYEKHIMPTLGAIAVAKVTADDVAAWYEDLDEQQGNGVSRPCYQTLSSMFTYATGRAKGQSRSFVPKVAETPCQLAGADRHKPVRTVTRQTATPHEVAELASRMPGREQLAVLLGAWAGLRIGEVLALRRRDVTTTGRGDGTRTFLIVERQVQARGGGLRETSPKSEAGTRTVPIPAALVPTLNDHLRRFAGRGPDGLLFPRQDKGDVWTHPNVLRTHFNAARDGYNSDQQHGNRPTLDGFTFHMLRHTALSHVGEAGATLAELKRFGGHADAKTVQRYQHADLDRLARLAEVMNQDVRVPGDADVVMLSEAGSG